MASSHAFNSLGQVFAAGGDTPLILDAAEGLGGAALLAAIAVKFPRLSSAEQQTLAAHVERAVSVASTVDESIIDADIPLVARLDEVPQDFNLFGGEDRGRRIRVTMTMQSGESGKEFMAKLDFANMPNLEELHQAVADYIDRFARDYPEAAARLGIHGMEEMAYNVVGIQRSY